MRCGATRSTWRDSPTRSRTRCSSTRPTGAAGSSAWRPAWRAATCTGGPSRSSRLPERRARQRDHPNRYELGPSRVQVPAQRCPAPREVCPAPAASHPPLPPAWSPAPAPGAHALDPTHRSTSRPPSTRSERPFTRASLRTTWLHAANALERVSELFGWTTSSVGQESGDVPLVQRVEAVVGLADDGDLLQRVRADDQVSFRAQAREAVDMPDRRRGDQPRHLLCACPATGGGECQPGDQPVVDDERRPPGNGQRLELEPCLEHLGGATGSLERRPDVPSGTPCPSR